MKTVMIDIKTKENYLENLWNLLEEEGYQVLKKWPDMPMESKDVLVLTDDNKVAKWAVENQIACIGYEAKNSGNLIKSAGTIIQGFEEITPEFLFREFKRFHGIPWKIADTKHLWIRESVKEDFEDIYKIYQQPETCRYMPGMEGEKEKERESFQAHIQYVYPFYGYGMWTILEKETGQVIGRAGLEQKEYRGHQILAAGYLIDRSKQGQGWGEEALKAVLIYAKEWVGAREIYTFIHPKNLASVQTSLRAGFSEIEKGVFYTLL